MSGGGGGVPQNLILSTDEDSVYITNGTGVPIDTDSTNEIQNISLSGTNLSITDGSTIDLSSLQDGTGTDNQTLSITGNSLSISRGNSVTIPGADNWGTQSVETSGSNISGDGTSGSPITFTEADGDPTNEIQTLSVSDGNNISLSNGGGTVTINDADSDPTNELQDLSLNTNTNALSITSRSGTINLSPYLDNTDDQNIDSLTLNGTNLEVFIEGGDSASVDLSSLSSGSSDTDWLKTGGTNTSTAITDDIYTRGNVGIISSGNTTLNSKLYVRDSTTQPISLSIESEGNMSKTSIEIKSKRTGGFNRTGIYAKILSNNKAVGGYFLAEGGSKSTGVLAEVNGPATSTNKAIHGIAPSKNDRTNYAGFFEGNLHIEDDSTIITIQDLDHAYRDDDLTSSFHFLGMNGNKYAEIGEFSGGKIFGMHVDTTYKIQFSVGASNGIIIYNDGTAELGGSFIQTSDKRYKKNIKTLESSTELLGKLNPVQYNFKDEDKYVKKGQFDNRLHFGLIAQELEEVLPNLVHTDNEGFKAVNYIELISLLIKSNQEQQIEIKELQKQVKTLSEKQ